MSEQAPEDLHATAANGDVDMTEPIAALPDVKQEPQANDIPSLNFPTDGANGLTPHDQAAQTASGSAVASAPAPPTAIARTSTPGGTRASTPAAQPGNVGVSTVLPPSAIISPANPHGSPTRVYLNQRVTPALLEGMKLVAAQEPERPLQWLGEFLLQKSKEVEGS